MSDEHGVSRRASLKGLGVMGAAVVLGAPVRGEQQAATKPAAAEPGKQPANLVEVAVGRFAKGHS